MKDHGVEQWVENQEIKKGGVRNVGKCSTGFQKSTGIVMLRFGNFVNATFKLKGHDHFL